MTAAVFFSSDLANPDTYGKFLADLQMYAVAGRPPDPDVFMQWFVSWQATEQGEQVAGRQPRALAQRRVRRGCSGPRRSSSIRSSARRS